MRVPVPYSFFRLCRLRIEARQKACGLQCQEGRWQERQPSGELMAKTAAKKIKQVHAVCKEQLTPDTGIRSTQTVVNTAESRLEIDETRQSSGAAPRAIAGCGTVESDISGHLYSFLASVVETARIAKERIDTPEQAAATAAELEVLRDKVARQRDTARALTKLLKDGAASIAQTEEFAFRH